MSDQERYRRVVEEGSNRKRDLAGYRRVLAVVEAERTAALAAEAEELAERGILVDVAAIWETARERLRASVPASTFALWVEPLTPVAAMDDTLYLKAPEGIRAWAERRYSALIAAAVADCSPYRRVSFGAPEAAA